MNNDRLLKAVLVSLSLAVFIVVVRALVRWLGEDLGLLEEIVLIIAGIGEILTVLFIVLSGVLAGLQEVSAQARALRREMRKWK